MVKGEKETHPAPVVRCFHSAGRGPDRFMTFTTNRQSMAQRGL